MKPAPELFRAACQGLGLRPEQALMVGDEARADGGACDLGIRTRLLPYSLAGRVHLLHAVPSPSTGPERRCRTTSATRRRPVT